MSPLITVTGRQLATPAGVGAALGGRQVPFDNDQAPSANHKGRRMEQLLRHRWPLAASTYRLPFLFTAYR